MRTRRVLPGVCAVFLFLIVAGEQAGPSPELAIAQVLPEQETLNSWWASPQEPTMLEVEEHSTLRNPESVKIHLVSGGQDRWINGYEAIVFLLVRGYVEYVTVNGEVRLRTTPKYRAWKSSKGPSASSVSFSLPLDARPNGPGEYWTRPSVTVTFDEVAKVARIDPSTVTVTHEFTYGDGTTEVTTWTYRFSNAVIGVWKLDSQNQVIYFDTGEGNCEVSIQKGTKTNPGPVTKQQMKWTATFDKIINYCRMGITGVPSWRKQPIISP